MATVWITYAWADDRENDVTFVAQELEAAGLTIKLDRWNIQAGKRLWEQIDKFITDPSESDAWLLYATVNSLGSQACKEEFSYALDRALKQRGTDFPIIGVFPRSVDDYLIPSGIKNRLHVSLTQRDWKELIVAAAEGRNADVQRVALEPYALTMHRIDEGARKHAIEMRPRAGSWCPFFAAVPSGEVGKVNLSLSHGSKNEVPRFATLLGYGSVSSSDGYFVGKSMRNEVTPTMSAYACFNELPTQIAFGVPDGGAFYSRVIGKG